MTDSPPATATAATEAPTRPRAGRPDEATSTADPEARVSFETVDPWVDEEHCSLPPDVLFDVLKNQRRRLVLEFLRESEGPVRIGTLAEHIAAFENDVSPRRLNAQQRKRVYIGLYQCHLPKMADVDVIEFNQARGIIELGAYGVELFPFLDATAESPWSPRPYFALAIVGSLAYLIASLFLPAWSGNLVVGGILTGIVLLGSINPRTG